MDLKTHSDSTGIAATRPALPPVAWKFPFRWPTNLLGPQPGLREIALVCWGLFIGSLLLPICFLIWIRISHGAASDFVYFYGVGRIFNTHGTASLYDIGLQLKVFNAIAPPLGGFYGPSPYPPFVAQFFSLFARAPFKLAFLLWMGASLALYLTGISLITRETFPKEKLKTSLIFCFALAFSPFVIHTFANGQIASIAFFAVCLAVFMEQRKRPVASGLALTILAYKPTLLILILPMLLITRRFKHLLGFVVGVICLFLEVMLLDGTKIWPAYIHFLTMFRHISQIGGAAGLRRWQFVDLNSLAHGLPGGQSVVTPAICAVISIAVFVWLVSLLWRSPAAGPHAQSLAWAATLTWTLLLNLYVPMYDSVLTVIAVTLTLTALRKLEWHDATRWVLLIAVLIFAAAWITGPIARRSGIQLFTVLLFAFGLMQLLLLRHLCAGPNPSISPDADMEVA